MNREDAKDLTLSIMVIVNIALAAVCAWLYVKSCDNADAIKDISDRLDMNLKLSPTLKDPSFVDKAKSTYEKVKSAAKKGYEAAKEEYIKE